jgi:hypothetical protein
MKGRPYLSDQCATCGAYLITGGLGSLGRLVTAWLSQHKSSAPGQVRRLTSLHSLYKKVQFQTGFLICYSQRELALSG